MTRKLVGTLLVGLGAMALSGCSTLKGAAIGAGAGAGVSAATGGDIERGAAVGGVAGGVIGTVAD